MKLNQKGIASIIVIVAAIAVLIVAGLFISGNKTFSPSIDHVNQANQNSQGAIQSDQGLMSTSQELDKTNVDGAFDGELNQNTSDSQSFTY